MLPDLSALLQWMLLNQCGLDPRWLYQNNYDDLKEGDVFDFIVVGSGSAGSVVASRLSENEKWRVLLVEAGDYPTAATEIPSYLNSIIDNESYDWKYLTEPSNSSCLGLKDGRCRWPRGKVLGGSSTINGMLYVRGLRSDYDSWERLGNTGWGWKDVLPYFEKSTNGKLNTTIARAWNQFRDILMLAGKQAGYSINDHEVDSGFFESLSTISDGRRCSSAKAYLTQLGKRKNLLISVKTHAVRILYRQKQAIGVQVINKGNQLRVFAKKEVVVSAGSINTPQLLMLSGIGPKEELDKLGGDVLADLPVGRNLQDHFLMRGIFVGVDPPVNKSLNLDPNYASALYCSKKIGPLATTGILNVFWFFNTKNETMLPNVQMHHIHFARKQGERIRTLLEQFGFPEVTIKKVITFNKRYDILTFLPTLARPKSRGKIVLKTNDYLMKPLIYPNYLHHPDDLEVMLGSIAHIKNLLSTPIFRSLNAQFLEVKPPNCASFDFDTTDFWECNFRNFGTSVFHPVGTCKMGPDYDPEAVVNPRLSVYGVTNLRVVDGSVMPNIINRNTNAACIMIGEKGAEMIKEDWENRN